MKDTHRLNTPQHTRRLALQGLLAGLGSVCMGSSFAQLASGKVVKVFVGFPAGQATDMVTRVIAEKLNALTGDNFIVDNRPGQGGSMALSQLAKSPPNGTVMMMAHMSALDTNPHIYKSVGYDTLKDFESVGLVGDLPFVLVCNPNLPAQNLKELIAYVKSNPDKLTNASSGNGTVSHLAMEELKRRAGLKVTHVPYKGSVAGLTDVVAGNVSMALETASAVRAHVESGRLRAIATGSSKRLGGIFSQVPTFKEQGMSDFTAVTWLMLLLPQGSPKALVQSTYTALMSVLTTPEMEQKLNALGLQPRFSTSPDEAAQYMKSEFAYWGEVVKRSNIEKE
jgi:tripartite-type tricarboxylate transporter receptor subunit TctC